MRPPRRPARRRGRRATARTPTTQICAVARRATSRVRSDAAGRDVVGAHARVVDAERQLDPSGRSPGRSPPPSRTTAPAACRSCSRARATTDAPTPTNIASVRTARLVVAARAISVEPRCGDGAPNRPRPTMPNSARLPAPGAPVESQLQPAAPAWPWNGATERDRHVAALVTREHRDLAVDVCPRAASTSRARAMRVRAGDPVGLPACRRPTSPNATSTSLPSTMSQTGTVSWSPSHVRLVGEDVRTDRVDHDRRRGHLGDRAVVALDARLEADLVLALPRERAVADDERARRARTGATGRR